jgi:hypothetical protein
MAKQPENQSVNLVYGRVTDRRNSPLANCIVQVYDRDIRSEQLLSETTTNREGKYQTTWLHSQLSEREKKEADILIKVLSPAKKTVLYTSDIHSIRFNASGNEEINITIQQEIQPEGIEYELLLKEVTFLANTIAIPDLQENREHQDITFLTKELDVPAQRIEYLVISHRLQQESRIDAPFFYALLRENTLLKSNDRTHNGRFAISLDADIQLLLFDAAMADPATIKQDLEIAVKSSVVNRSILKESGRFIEMLQQYKSKAEEYYKTEYPRKALDVVTRFVTEGKMLEVQKLFEENRNNLNVFFDKLTDGSFFTTKEKAKDAKTSIELGKLFGFGSEMIPHVMKSKKISASKDVKKLARLTKKEWEEEILKANSKKERSAEDKKTASLFASAIVRRMEKAYPTVAFTAQLEREKKPLLKNHENIVTFLNKHEAFDLTKHNVDLYLKEKNVSKKESEAIREELKSVQRVFKLIPSYSKTKALMNEDIHSAQGIVAAGKTRFVNEIAPKAGIEPKEAKEIFEKAEYVNTAATLVVGELQDTLRAMDISSLETSTLSKKLEAVSKDFPNLKSLFKLTDTCSCDHCRSVYSPAAYLVEILQFLDKRSVTDITVMPHVTSNLAKDVLFERRPDLGDIDLGCENATTPVKYIDLVCELLEETIAPDQGIPYTGDLSDGTDKFQGTISAALLGVLQAAGIPVTDVAQVFETEVTTGSPDALPHYLRDKKAVCKIINTGGNNYEVFRLRQTLSSAEELDAAPEYVNRNAYTELKGQWYAFKLPFDLDHVEGKAYFERFGISRADLMFDFQIAGNPPDESIAAEKLGLTDEERDLIVTRRANTADQQFIWNAPAQWDSPPIAGDVLDYMKRVDHFLDKTGLSYKELDLLLTLKFIDPTRKLFIKNMDLPCDTQQKEIANLTLEGLDRIHAFLRLQKKTGWKFEVLDAMISQAKLGKGSLNDAFLIKAATLKKISEITGIKLEEFVGFYGDIPHEILRDDAPKPFYYQVFLNKAKNGFIDEGLLPEKVDGSQLLSSFLNSISVSLQLKQPDLEKLLPLLPDGALNFQNLSYLFAASRLMKKLKLKIDDFLIFKELTAIDFSDSPQKTLEFVHALDAFGKSPLKLADVKYMLWHKAVNLPVIDDKIKQILEKLQKEYQNNFALNKSKFNGNLTAIEQQETLQAELSKLSEVSEEEVKTFLKFIDKDWVSVAVAKAMIDAKLGVLFDVTAIKNKMDELEAAALTKDQDILDHQAALQALRDAQDLLKKAANPGEVAAANAAIAAAEAQLLITTPKYNIASGKNLLQALLDAIALYQLEAGKQVILEQTVSTAFKADPEFTKVLLKYAQLQQPAPGKGLLSTLLQTDALIDTDITHVVPVLPAITSVTFPDQYAALKLINKLVPLINAFQMSNDQLLGHFENNKLLSWFEFESIPYDAGQLEIDYNKYIAFAGIWDLEKQFTPVANPADAEKPISFLTAVDMLLPGSTATRADFLDALSLLTGYAKDDLDDIDASKFPAFSFNNYKDVANWLWLFRCAEDLRKLDSSVLQVKDYIKPVLTDAEVLNLRASLKSRYDEDTWLSTLKEVMDTIRPQKRNALVAYILATNPEMKDENDLFDYLLVDVEMEACMPSSRIVQAHNTIQLFVQRCLMGLEPKATADLDHDKNWEQWKWMKNYRVWEANRKIFLYPENWLEPDLRDDKSFLFKEFENEIQQNELTNFTAEEALIRYVEKLDGIAFLEVIATWYQKDILTMHVFARTKGGDPSIYYYRRFEQERYWTPWEKVELDISGDQLLAFVRNNRLCLAWPVYTEVPDAVQSATIPSSTPGTVNVDRPKRRLKIQLAVSELANNKWQPKKISSEGVMTPDAGVPDEFDKTVFNMIYIELTQQIWIFTTFPKEPVNYINIKGIFDIAGCKGYPEKVFEGDSGFPDFFPDFKDTGLISQRYNEYRPRTENDLAVRNGISMFSFYEILNKTPGTFRITYPHQLTTIDLIALMFEYLLILLFKSSVNSIRDQRTNYKIPLGTLLPYFEEDSKHAYVIIPGFYKRTLRERGEYTFTDAEKRTASDAFQLIGAITNLLKKYIAKYVADPSQDISALIHECITDVDFQKAMADLSSYEGFDFFYNFLIGIIGNEELDKVFEELRDANGLVYGEEFKNMYHPLVCALRTTLYKYGIPELMKRETQLQKTSFDFATWYEPNSLIVPKTSIKNPDGTLTWTYPIEDLDFASDGSYSVYNWELFYHLPLLLATRLTTNQRFEEALTWFHYMFNPTGALAGNTPQKYWVTKPFYLNQEADYINQRIDTLLYKIADPSTPERKELEFAIDQWRSDPFKPDVVARFRPVAYQKSLLMKYIDNLTEWGDYLFRQDTMESVAQATQMYILADKLLGPKPRIIPPVIHAPYETYNQIEAKIDAFGNALIDLENILLDVSVLPEHGDELPSATVDELPPPPLTLAMLYFCIPQNDKMLEYWDRIADRLFKIRHCQNIDGVERTLALFAPPIDPAMLVRAAASGLDLSSVIAGLNAPAPFYRFNVLSQKATELAQEVRGLGSSLLTALEKKDAEVISLLRSELEIKVLNAVKQIKVLQIKESTEQIEVLKRTKKVTEERDKYYSNIQKIIAKEQLNLDKLSESHDYQMASQIIQATAGVLALIPDLVIGASGFGGSPHAAAKWGGTFLAHSASAAASVLGVLSTAASYEASRASILGGYDRRFDDWKFQERVAKKELASIDKQIAAAEIRKEIAETDLKNHELQIDNAKKTDEAMRSKFTNKELYDWMIGQISSVYFKAYKLSHDIAKKAERSYHFELGNDDSFISYGYWDSMKKGLQTADLLIHDIKRMETSYLDKNKREYELTKHVSLALLDPLALVRLRATGVCDFDIPEALFDMDYAGHYFRRLKSVSISLPCVAGPYTSVSAKLSLVNNRYRKNVNADNIATTGYFEDPGNDERFVYNIGAIQSIAASNAQNDSGMFELNFRDERYLPFEGTGAISGWRLELPQEVRQFDYNTISDVIIHVKYTAREGGSGLKGLSNASLKERLFVLKQQLAQQGLHIAIDLKHDLANEWNLLKKNNAVDVKIDKMRLPYMAQSLDTAIEDVMFVAKVKNNPAAFTISIDGTPLNLSRVDEWKLCRGINNTIELDTPFNLSVSAAQIGNLEELMMVVKYSF